MPRYAFSYTEVELNSDPAFPEGHKAYRPLVQVEMIMNGDKSVP
jgi:hypothetical protein